MTATQLIDGLLSQDAGVKDRAETELKVMTAETAEKVGSELLLYGVRECQTVLKTVAGADTVNACLVALGALESAEYDVRAAGLDVFLSVSPLVAAEASRKGLTAKRIEALRLLVEDGQYMKGFCESISQTQSGDRTAYTEGTLRLVVFLDGKLGPRGLAMLLRSCATLMLGEDTKEEQTDALAEQAARLRRCAAVVFTTIWIGDPAKQFNYNPTTAYAEREKAISRIRRLLDNMEQREVSYGEAKFKGVRYGDYLFEQALNGDGTAESRAAGCLRLQWWRGDDVTISGDGYAEAVDRFNAMGRRPKTQLFSELRKWWVEYRTKSE